MAMAKHHRMMPLLRLLVRLGWQRDPELWTVRCRDGYGRQARLLVHLAAGGIYLTVSEPGPLQLNVLQTGRLHAALHDAILSLDQLAGPGGLSVSRKPSRAECPLPALSPGVRQRIEYRVPERPSVAQLTARLTDTQ
ncbi:MAG TPA: hypothetical protein VE709_00635 [Pseudonocardiaceae bacterium]|nr:hypothetical protein [Pseudonocardiaceae bacterium]